RDQFNNAPTSFAGIAMTLSPNQCVARDLFAGEAHYPRAGVQLRTEANYRLARTEREIARNTNRRLSRISSNIVTRTAVASRARDHYRACAAAAARLPADHRDGQELRVECEGLARPLVGL
ncbi:MAG: hypothetical protein AAF654_06045, partial [Myxococcota bacterium]